jgi:hypothetical protein
MSDAPYGYADGEPVRLAVPTLTSDGRTVEAGWTGKICMLTTSLGEAHKTGVYEVNLDEEYEKNGEYWPLLKLPSAYFERAAAARRPDELRQGDRVRFRTDISSDEACESYEAGEICTVLNTRVQSDGVFHDVQIDFGETLMAVPRDALEYVPGSSATVTYGIHGRSVEISFNDTSL